jgi:hypothetical protein
MSAGLAQKTPSMIRTKRQMQTDSTSDDLDIRASFLAVEINETDNERGAFFHTFSPFFYFIIQVSIRQ